MDLQSLDPRIRTFVPVHTAPTISCCNCGKPMKSDTGLNMCNECVSLSVDITEDVQKEGELVFCKNCERLHCYPSQWIPAQRESRELLGACLKRLRGLNKVRLVDAKYLWTEPHSRRTKIQITVEGEAKQFQNVIVQQDAVIEFVETTAQCPDCAKSYTANTWRANIQVRQKVDNKRTFFYLEQLILKHRAHRYTVSIQESKEGLDFFYNQRNHAEKMLEFLTSAVPVRMSKSSELISKNIHTSVSSYKFSYSVEIVPICKEDLVVLPKKLARSLGNINPLTLCSKISSTVHLIDPVTLQTAELTSVNYWKHPFRPVLTSQKLTEYVILDIEPVGGHATSRYALADVTIARSVDLGSNDQTYYVRTHLGGILHPGDTALGYHLSNTNLNHELWDELDMDRVPDIILVKKSYPDKTRTKNRNWKLKRMAKEYNEDADNAASRGKGKAADAFARSQREYEEFLREVEEDPEIRDEINLYRAKLDAENAKKKEEEEQAEQDEEVEDEEQDDDYPTVQLDELKLEDSDEEFAARIKADEEESDEDED